MADKRTEIKGIYKTHDGVALVNKDNQALAAYKAQKNKDRRIAMLEKQINTIKEDMTDIKAMLQKLVGRNGAI